MQTDGAPDTSDAGSSRPDSIPTPVPTASEVEVASDTMVSGNSASSAEPALPHSGGPVRAPVTQPHVDRERLRRLISSHEGPPAPTRHAVKALSHAALVDLLDFRTAQHAVVKPVVIDDPVELPVAIVHLANDEIIAVIIVMASAIRAA